MFKKPFSFEGRIRRMEYGLSYLGYIAGIVGIVLLGQQNTTLSALLVILFIPLLWFMLAQCAKRCHDRGNSGWWQIIPFYRMWLLFADSDHGDNGYGPNPKGIGNHDEVDEIGNYIQR